MSYTKKIEFVGGNGEVLAAALELPDDKPVACALFAHCFTCGKDVFAASRITKKLAQQGIAVLRFDFTGIGCSDGEFANTNFTSNIDDLLAAAEFLTHEYDAPSLLIGHSLGGAAVLAAAPKLDSVRAVVTIGAPYEPSHVEHLFTCDIEEIERTGNARVAIAGREFTIQKQFLDDLRDYQEHNYIAHMRKALLVMHAPRDEVVGIDNAKDIFLAAKHPKSFVSLDDADHLLSKRVDALYVADVITAWASRYMASRHEPMLRVPDEDRMVEVTETSEGKFTNQVTVGPHTFRADEPESVGGEDSGPSPYEFLMAGLGACTTMTMRMYVERKGWPMDRASVRLKHEKVTIEEEGKKRRIDRIHRHIAIEGELDDAQRQRIYEIANRCPVHRTLENGAEVESHLIDSDG